MRITIKKLDHFKRMAIASQKAIYDRFVRAHDGLNNQNTEAIKVIAEYNFWGGYIFAMLKIEEYRQLKPSDENNPLEIDKIDM